MVNDCSYANPVGSFANPSESGLGSSNCVNEALNEAHFAASGGTLPSTGAYVDVDRVVQTSTTTNSCDNLDDDTCKNTARNTFGANAANKGIININEDVKQTSNIVNSCNEAECLNSALNFMMLTADNGATVET